MVLVPKLGLSTYLKHWSFSQSCQLFIVPGVSLSRHFGTTDGSQFDRCLLFVHCHVSTLKHPNSKVKIVRSRSRRSFLPFAHELSLEDESQIVGSTWGFKSVKYFILCCKAY